jgi:hypothetical protein
MLRRREARYAAGTYRLYWFDQVVRRLSRSTELEEAMAGLAGLLYSLNYVRHD